MNDALDRRAFLAALGAGGAALVLGGCGSAAGTDRAVR
jgi:hypothetical protein